MIFFSSFQLEAIFVRVFITNTPSQKGSQRGSRERFSGRWEGGSSGADTVQGSDLGGYCVCSGDTPLSLPEPRGQRRNLRPLPPQTRRF